MLAKIVQEWQDASLAIVKELFSEINIEPSAMSGWLCVSAVVPLSVEVSI